MGDILKNQMPVIIRYLLASFFTYLASHGLLTADQHAYLGDQMDVIVGIVGNLAIIAYALWRRPSPTAMEAAKEIDQKIPKGTEVIIQTPAHMDNIYVGPKK